MGDFLSLNLVLGQQQGTDRVELLVDPPLVIAQPGTNEEARE